MCLISRKVENVNNTKIFCGVDKNQSKQITVYANTVNNVSDNNAMVLPVPFPETVKFHDLSNYKNFFNDCADCFYLPKTKGVSRALMLNGNSDTYSFNMDSLKVIDVGSYKVSLAESLNDLHRVNKNVFDLSEGLADILKKNYSNSNFGFIICKLAKGNESYHPFAYSHNIFNSKIFIPTKHYHDDSNNQNEYQGMFADAYSWANKSNDFMKKTNDDSYADDWGHDIYLYNIDINSNQEVKKMNKSRYLWEGSNKIQFSKLGFALDKKLYNFKKVQINGSNPNIDLILHASKEHVPIFRKEYDGLLD